MRVLPVALTTGTRGPAHQGITHRGIADDNMQ